MLNVIESVGTEVLLKRQLHESDYYKLLQFNTDNDSSKIIEVILPGGRIIDANNRILSRRINIDVRITNKHDIDGIMNKLNRELEELQKERVLSGITEDLTN